MVDAVAVIREHLIEAVAAPATGALDSGITATGATITLGSGEGASFPIYQSFPVLIGSELMHVRHGAAASDTLTLAGRRGAFGTTAAAHSAAGTVSQANLYLVIGTYIESPRLPNDYKNTRPAIGMAAIGGMVEANYAEIQHPRFQFKCWGGSEDPRDANTVYRLLHDRLHRAWLYDTAEGRLLSAHEDVRGQDLIDPDAFWPFTMTMYATTVIARSA